MRKSMISWVSIALALIAALSSVPADASQTGSALIVDTDMGLDDVRAIFALLADSTAGLEAILTVEGSADVGAGTDNLLGLLESNHVETIPVLVGRSSAGLGAPPWRQTADRLAGAPFPPPRELTALAADPARLAAILESQTEIEYLALGPLSNLADLAKADTAAFQRIREIWMPARILDRAVSGWNLSYDREAAQVVLSRATSIVILDVTTVGDADAVEFLSSLDGDSQPVSWIEHLLRGPGEGHLMFYDDLAAAAVLRPDLVRLSDETYRLAMKDDQAFEIEPAPDGNARVASLIDSDATLAFLKSLWERGPRERHLLHAGSSVAPMMLIKSFHGHLGPYVVIGYRMGKLALEELHSDGHFGISASVHSPLEPPRSCLIDGVQIGSGCTLGKGNIKVLAFDGPAWAVFETDDGRAVTVRMRPGIPSLVEDLIAHEGVEAAGQEVFGLEGDSLFMLTRDPER